MFGMQLDRFGCNHQFALYLLIREICVEPLQNLQLAPGQWLQAFFRQEIFLTEIRAGEPWSFMPGMNRRSFEWWGRGVGLLSGEADPGGLDCTRECC
jgi:hypothetical protein